MRLPSGSPSLPSGRWRTPAAGALSGVLLSLAFPPVGWVVLLPLALVPWLVVLMREESRGRALLSGAVFGVVHWCASIPWIVYVVTHYGGQSPAMGVVCLVILAAILAEWPAFVAWGTVAAAPAGSGWRAAAFPLLWMASEHARSFIYGGFPWNLTAHALYRHPVWLQSASIWGAYGVGGLAVAVAALLARAVAVRRLVPLAAAALLALLAGVFGLLGMASRPSADASVSVALIQPNLTEEARRTPEGAALAYRSVIAQAREAAAASPALLVIPESAFPVYWERSEPLRHDLAELASPGTTVLFNDVEEEPDGSYYNVARAVTPEGLATTTYRKVHLVPFGEYVPLPRVFFFVRQVSTEIGAFSAARAPEVIRFGGLALGVGICYEILYASLARREVSDGANLLVTISNDSWYGRAGAQEQHFAGAALRAVENRRFLLRAAITGISGIVDDRGRILAASRPDEKVTVTGTARPRSERTFWVRWGYWIPRAADALALGVLLFGLVRLSRSRRLLRAESRRLKAIP